MEQKRTSKIAIDPDKNRLNITMTCSISKEEMERIYADILICVPELQPGFDVLTDFSNCTIIHLGGAPTFKMVMEFLLEKHVGKVVRVVGRTKLVFNQLSRITENIKGYTPVYVSTLKEAEEIFSTKSNNDNTLS
jgi:hypothetical protein